MNSTPLDGGVRRFLNTNPIVKFHILLNTQFDLRLNVGRLIAASVVCQSSTLTSSAGMRNLQINLPFSETFDPLVMQVGVTETKCETCIVYAVETGLSCIQCLR